MAKEHIGADLNRRIERFLKLAYYEDLKDVDIDFDSEYQTIFSNEGRRKSEYGETLK